MKLTTEMMLVAVAIQLDEDDCNKFIHSRNQNKFYRKLSLCKKIERQRVSASEKEKGIDHRIIFLICVNVICDLCN